MCVCVYVCVCVSVCVRVSLSRQSLLRLICGFAGEGVDWQIAYESEVGRWSNGTDKARDQVNNGYHCCLKRKMETYRQWIPGLKGGLPSAESTDGLDFCIWSRKIIQAATPTKKLHNKRTIFESWHRNTGQQHQSNTSKRHQRDFKAT